jgi:hypothetical protein
LIWKSSGQKYCETIRTRIYPCFCQTTRFTKSV